MNRDAQERARDVAIEAAREAGKILVGCHRDGSPVLSDAGRDLKIQADRDAEQAILRHLATTGYPILAEESGAHGAVCDTGYLWVVDPLDGTINFNRGIPFFGTSIALLLDGEPVVGVVYDWSHDEMFSAIVGRGCWLNDFPIAVSTISDASQAVLATGLPTFRDHDLDSLAAFAADLKRFKKVRMLGSAALMLAGVAAGRLDAYQEQDIMLWDVAAGIALVRGAGGYVSITPSESHQWGRHVQCSGQSVLWNG